MNKYSNTMKKFLRLLRLEYLVFFLLPYFAGLVYMKSLYFVDKFDILFIIGVIFFTISLNVHNDICDRQLRGYKKSFLKYIAIISLALGLLVFPNPFLMLTAVVMYLYNWKLKKMLYISLLPAAVLGLCVLAILGVYDILPLAAVIFASVSAQSLHQFVDRDIRLNSYFYIFVLFWLISLLIFSLILIRIDIALSWLAFMAAAGFGLSFVTISRNVILRKLVHFSKRQRASVIANYWAMLIFLAGWYFLITLS